ncbi:MAG: hypothetical protein LBT29_07470 [Flavobacteriaceae bacterium]|jgi:hypothetical protein|nr:hypothetical protein [Flavobacteriaceae bacterium]
MRKILVSLLMVGMIGFINAQAAFSGKNDMKFQIGANFQNGGTGIMTSFDYGLGESFSIGAQAGYLLGVKKVDGKNPDAGDRFDMKARFNAHLGNVLGLPAGMDVYPGLDLGLKNFGGHAGVRYFFKDGFGLFTEINFPIARYKDAKGFEKLNNQFAVSVGASFDITK